MWTCKSESLNSYMLFRKVVYLRVQDKFVKLVKISEMILMGNEEIEFSALFSKYLVWKDSQQSQTDGYKYERSFIEFTRSMNKELFEISVKNMRHYLRNQKKVQTSLGGINVHGCRTSL